MTSWAACHKAGPKRQFKKCYHLKTCIVFYLASVCDEVLEPILKLNLPSLTLRKVVIS